MRSSATVFQLVLCRVISAPFRKNKLAMNYTKSALLLLQFVIIAPLSHAGFVIPVGLNPGDNYYLAFVTNGSRDATSSNIADYDQFVQSQAMLNPSLTGTSEGIQWKALGSTATVNAKDHLGISEAPIYLLDGTTKVAYAGSQLWSGAIGHQISLNQFALEPVLNPVWTGTLQNGNAYPGAALGSLFTEVGRMDTPLSTWVSFYADLNTISSYHVYAFSPMLTVPGFAEPPTVPEPTSLILWGMAFTGLAFSRVRRRATSKL